MRSPRDAGFGFNSLRGEGYRLRECSSAELSAVGVLGTSAIVPREPSIPGYQHAPECMCCVGGMLTAPSLGLGFLCVGGSRRLAPRLPAVLAL